MKRTLLQIFIVVGVTIMLTSSTVHITPQPRGKQVDEDITRIYALYLDSLAALNQKYSFWSYNKADTLANPYYFPLFAAPTFYAAPIHRTFGLTSNSDPYSNDTDTLITQTDQALCYIYGNAPWLITNQEDASLGQADKELAQDFRPQVKLSEKATNNTPPPDEFEDDWRIVVRKPNFWTFKANTSLQLMQTYVSDNWYKGGESNYSWLVQMNFEANYNNKQKVILTNTLETKLGFLSSRNDEKHKFRTNADLLRMINKLGLRATKHWYYTLLLQSWTQFYPGLKSNDDYIYSDFMSPFESLFSIGMDYSLNVKKFSLSATISPIACDFKYVDRKYLATSFGIDEGKHTNWGFGSNITVKYNWDMFKNVSWNGRIYYYSDYSKVQLEWENTFNLKINKYLTTKLFLYPRFDDSVYRAEDESYIQFNELLSFGLNLSF